MSAPDLFKLELPVEPAEQPSTGGDVVPLRAADTAEAPAVADVEEPRPGLRDRLAPVLDRLGAGWRTAWVGDGLLGVPPRPVADLVRQYWTDPKPYIRDALVLRIPYALYGVPVVVVTAAAHLLLLVLSYFTLLVGVVLLVVVITLLA